MAASRLGAAFSGSRGATGLIPFITAGYPNLETSFEILRGFARLGVTAVEIGIPFSDPIADGPEIQRASEAALRQGVGVPHVLELVRALRQESELPVVLMTYANPVLRDGIESFAAQARGAGTDGALISDLPPDEAPEIWTALDQAGLDTIVLVAPTTAEDRVPLLLERARGFVYCLARTGVTGASRGFSAAIPDRVAVLRRHTQLPIAVGFGISTAEQARALRGVVDAVVVGAAFMKAVTADVRQGAADRVLTLAAELLGALAA
jgi:tryptophan synthase alpha chain